jgi:hypothetical protein
LSQEPRFDSPGLSRNFLIGMRTVADRDTERRRPMTRSPSKSDRNFSADPPAGDAGSLADLLDQSEILEAFDETIRLRFGRMISAAAAKPAKRR